MKQINWHEVAKEMAYLVYQLMDGDTPDISALRKYGFTDENDEWIYDDD